MTAHSLKEKTILITGAASGIGEAVAIAYAQQGATVILLDKSIPKLEKVYDAIINKEYSTPAIYPLDLQGASIPDYEELADKIHDNFGGLDGLVHCAASLGQLAPIEHQDPKVWLETLHVNLTAPYLLTRACLPKMQLRNKASIIFTTDVHKENAYWAGYGIAKAGIEALSKQLANELEAEERVRVNCIDPGNVQTELHAKAFPAIDPNSLVKPQSVVASYLYLMGNDSLKITGELIKAQ
jgi:NAD(P)-dependent dehydrogenase (short-subunit alcohol dehydrogenase family)